jgi:hypothetical protein
MNNMASRLLSGLFASINRSSSYINPAQYGNRTGTMAAAVQGPIYVKCEQTIEANTIPIFRVDANNVWSEAHGGDSSWSNSLFLATHRASITIFKDNISRTEMVVCLTHQNTANPESIYVSRVNALRFFIPAQQVANQSSAFAFDGTTTSTGVNSADDWTSRLGVFTLVSKPPASMTPSPMMWMQPR